MSSEGRTGAPRANGALARGRKTQAGIERSRLNAVKHGAFAKSLLLNNESPTALAKLRDEYFAYLQPTSPIERDLVEEMIVAKWLRDRFWRLENSTINYKMDEQKAAVEAKHHRIYGPSRTAIAHKDLYDNTSALSHIQRAQASNSRYYHRVLRQLQDLRGNPQNQNEQTTLIRDSDTTPPCASAKLKYRWPTTSSPKKAPTCSSTRTTPSTGIPGDRRPLTKRAVSRSPSSFLSATPPAI